MPRDHYKLYKLPPPRAFRQDLVGCQKRERGMMGTRAEREMKKEDRERLGTRQFKK